jgi:hypothetical protein
MFTKLETNRGNGYKLQDNGFHWSLQYDRGIYSGSLKQVCTFAVVELGFEMRELELGVMAIEETFKDTALYGIMRTFMYPIDSNKGETYVN